MCDVKQSKVLLGTAVVLLATAAGAVERLEDIDKRMVSEFTVVSNGVKWIDGMALPLEGKSSANVARYYDRLTDAVTTNVNQGVHWLKRFTAGMQFRFSTDSRKLRFRWHPIHLLENDNLSRQGQSGIDIYRFDEQSGRWRYLKTGSPKNMQEGGAFEVEWRPGEACIVNLPNYNGLKDFSLGVDEGATVKPLQPRKSGVTKPVVFYGTSITQGGCASRPGMGFVNIIGRNLDVPVINLGFSGSGNMELEMADHLADIDASCYVIDTLWNTGGQRHEKFIRILRAKRSHVPIIITDKYDALGRAPKGSARLARMAYEKLVAEGYDRLYWLEWDRVYDPDGEDTVDGVHASDKGMMNIARALGPLVATALGLDGERRNH